MGKSRSVRGITPPVAQRTGPPGETRLEPRSVRLKQRASPKKGARTGPNPTDRGRAGSTHHVVVDRRGLPLAALLSAANVHDKREALPLLDAVPPVQGPRGRPRRRPEKGHGDKGYDYADVRQGMSKRHVIPRIARKEVESKEHLGRYRWVAERTFALLHQKKRLRVREERGDEMHLALLQLGCCLLLYQELERQT
nr:IS5 family transposase [Melittangium boletus]